MRDYANTYSNAAKEVRGPICDLIVKYSKDNNLDPYHLTSWVCDSGKLMKEAVDEAIKRNGGEPKWLKGCSQSGIFTECTIS